MFSYVLKYKDRASKFQYYCHYFGSHDVGFVILHALLWCVRDTTMVALWIENVKAGYIDRLVQIISKETAVAMVCIFKRKCICSRQ